MFITVKVAVGLYIGNNSGGSGGIAYKIVMRKEKSYAD